MSEDLVKLRGTDITVFRRMPGQSWRVDQDGVNAVTAGLKSLGYHEVERPWQVNDALRRYLRDIEHFAPGQIPSAIGALAEALGRGPAALPGEKLEALGEPSFVRYAYGRDEDPEVLRDERASVREIEVLVREKLKLNPSTVALRPLVGTTENAARACWHYGMWGIYRRDTSGRATELFAVYGHVKGGFGCDAWHDVQPEGHNALDWWRPSLRDFQTVRCAMTGRVLYEWGHRTDVLDPLSEDLFVAGKKIDGPGELDEVLLAEDPVERPALSLGEVALKIDGAEAARARGADHYSGRLSQSPLRRLRCLRRRASGNRTKRARFSPLRYRRADCWICSAVSDRTMASYGSRNPASSSRGGQTGGPRRTESRSATGHPQQHRHPLRHEGRTPVRERDAERNLAAE